ncbi:DUF4129 domain-containing protein [Hoyosella altamirensis]|uniref:Protein-glutamine gamma-glutamyltransferase-like C-terminal domain-containing protein n=1 Tax=Hoyosella altamirensis TaxID=616997 RepID=A0A839RIJ2_9ACTN|nr:DUF4129 domain-containing protein [Hoyosella altamirensis]MBB3036632.1 hypothetical protein [Hoyosella altamirensis]
MWRGTIPVEIDRDSAREAAREELSRSVYTEAQPSLPERVMLWLLDRVQDAIDAIFDGANALAPGGPGSLVILLAIMITAAIIIRLRMGRVARSARMRRAIFSETRRSAAEHRRLADAAAAVGDLDEAVHERFRAIVRALEERGVINDAAGQTATEVALRAGEELAGCAEPLRSAARTFDDVYYGHRSAARGAYDDLVRTDALVQSAALIEPEKQGAV